MKKFEEIKYINWTQVVPPESLLADKWTPIAVSCFQEMTYFVDIKEPWKEGFWLDGVDQAKTQLFTKRKINERNL